MKLPLVFLARIFLIKMLLFSFPVSSIEPMSRALQESLLGYLATATMEPPTTTTTPTITNPTSEEPIQSHAVDIDADLAMALRMSEEEQRRRREEIEREQAMFEQALRLSLEEK